MTADVEEIPGVNEEQIDLSDGQADDALFKRACQLAPNAERCYVSDCTKLTSDGFAAMSGLIQVEDISVPGTCFSDSDIAYLLNLKTLRELDVSATRITIEGARSLIGLPLYELIIEVGDLTREWVDLLATFTHLRRLWVYLINSENTIALQDELKTRLTATKVNFDEA